MGDTGINLFLNLHSGYILFSFFENLFHQKKKKSPFLSVCYISIKRLRYNKIKWLRETCELAQDHTALSRPVRSSMFLLLLCSLTRKVLDNLLSILGSVSPFIWSEKKTKPKLAAEFP